MNYQEALAYLKKLTKFGMNFGLDRIIELLRLLGNPHNGLKIIHIGGTNGKGSTTAMLSCILQESGYSVGMFTSPHLHSYRERFRVGNQLISKAKISTILSEMQPLLKQMIDNGYEHPTEFEVSTAMALKYFNDENVDIVILEVGLGGALDSTNVIDKPLLSIITNVAMDHMDYLGNTLQEIAVVKAGLIKKGCTVITASVVPEVLAVIKKQSRTKNAPLYILGKDFNYKTMQIGRSGSIFSVEGLKGTYLKVNIPLLGEHQGKNVAVAITAAEILCEQGYTAINRQAIKNGLEKVVWPARLEVFSDNPLILLDVAHNVDGILTLRNALEGIFPMKKVVLVIGMLADKEREKAINIIAPLAHKIFVTRPLSPRAGNWEEIKEMAEKKCDDVTLVPKIIDSVKLALNNLNNDEMLVITGSFYMVSEARRWLKENY